ncbi:unnamed protein product [Mytilus edulis]|uniref:B box-type domain-containing protein n=1 Tax=Mytilus edulis TaxID=6550 RepID=A0A8S3R179_MYTED|nr:unnamed protein product [Mytilus edulis]
MTTSTNIVCGICDAQHITKCANHWCPECDEGLCYDCEKHHSISKASRKHEHRKCVGLLDLDEVVKTLKTSVLIDNLEKSLQEIATNINKIITDRTENLKNIKAERQGFHNQIKQVRDKINTHLDKIEQQIISDLLSEERKIKSEIESLIDKLSEKIINIQDLRNNIDATKKTCNGPSNISSY